MDAYAQRVLEKHAAAAQQEEREAPDDSLGPYVTSLLRNMMMSDDHAISSAAVLEDVTLLPDYEGLIELLQEHCGLETPEQAQEALQEISKAVASGRVPHNYDGESSSMNRNDSSNKNSNTNGFPAMQSLNAGLPPPPPPVMTTLDEEEFPTLTQATAPASTVISPNRADSLIPLHLLDEDPVATSPASQHPAHVDGEPNEDGDQNFPPLGASAGKKTVVPSVAAAKKSSKQPATDLAASLFRPPRNRQNSTDETSPKLLSAVTKNQYAAAVIPDPYIEPQHYEAVVDMLLAMNGESLSPDAAYAAAVLGSANVHVAQYVVEAAMTAPPICRHLLGDGCYRSDCQYSHGLDGHTCIFWLRGRCGKGETCRFLHGFHETLLPDMTTTAEYGDESSFYPSTASSSYGYNNSSDMASSSSWMPPPSVPVDVATSSTSFRATEPTSSSFANIATAGYDMSSSFAPTWNASDTTATSSSDRDIPTVRIPQDLWNPQENRDASVFQIADPMERYRHVQAMSSSSSSSTEVIDLHFQSTKTFATVLSQVLPDALQRISEVWIVTGTGHHVGSQTHQKGGGALETAVLQWLLEQGYIVYRGRDRNGQGGAILVKR